MISYIYFTMASILMVCSCASREKVLFKFDEVEIEYIYKDSPISRFYYSIDRSVIIRNATKTIKFDILPDIEMYDEARFSYTEELLLDSIDFQRILLIRDPFAFTIIDLEEVSILYNSHGEDDIMDRIIIQNEEKCIGKVSRKKFEPDNCIIDFL